MIGKFRSLATTTLLGVGLATSVFAQTTALEGDVKGPDGAPMANAQVLITRTDIKGNYKVKTNKKGHYYYGGLPIGTYDVAIEVDGQKRDEVKGVRTTLGDPKPVNFSLQDIAKKQEAMQQAMQTGQLTEEQKRDMTPEQREAMEKAMKDRAKDLAKNKELNDAFNQGREALEAKNYDAAIAALTKGTELDPKQIAFWSYLGEANVAKAKTLQGADRATTYEKAVEAYKKALEIQPNDAAMLNQVALAYGEMKKFDEMETALNQAATLDAANAGRYYFNLGAIMVNNNQAEKAQTAFAKVPEGSQYFAQSQYQMGILMVSKATTKADGTVVPMPGTVEAFQKYLELEPTGQFAESAKSMISTLGGKVESTYRNPNAKETPKPARKK